MALPSPPRCAKKCASCPRDSDATGQRPGLAVILVGDSAASQVYVRNKIRACEAAGFHSVSEHLPEETTEAALLARLDELNKDPAVHASWCSFPCLPTSTRAA